MSQSLLKQNKYKAKPYGNTLDLEISPKAVKKAVQDAASKGQLDTDGRACTIADTMRSLGWNLKMSRDNKLTWQPDN